MVGTCDMRWEQEWASGINFLLIIIFTGRDELSVFVRGRRVYRMVGVVAASRKTQATVWEDLGACSQHQVGQFSMADNKQPHDLVT